MEEKKLYITPKKTCPYLQNKVEQKQIVNVDCNESFEWVSTLSRFGFRRSYKFCYIPICENCQACISVRVVLNDFVLNKKMKKTLRLNKNLDVFLVQNIASTEQYTLFRSYLDKRHFESEMNLMDFEEYRAMIEDSPTETMLLEIRDKETASLEAVMLFDVLDDGFSAVYSFFNPLATDKSLGNFCILNLILSGHSLGLPYLYLGYMIKECQNMIYKERYHPIEYYIQKQWIRSLI